MKKFLSILGGFGGGAALLMVSSTLVTAHLALLTDVREDVLPLAADIPPLERRLAVLTEQLELTALQASLQSGSPEEKLQAYVLPEKQDLRRLLAFFDVTRLLLERGKMLRGMSGIEVGQPTVLDPQPSADASRGIVEKRTISFQATLSDAGFERLFSTLELTGLLTVGDALTDAEIDRLFILTEAENYAGIVAVEKFLSTDLASYAREPRPAEDQLLKSFSSERFLQEFRGLLAGTRLASAREILGGDWGEAYAAQKVWPVQFLGVDRVSVELLPDGWNRVSFTLSAHTRRLDR